MRTKTNYQVSKEVRAYWDENEIVSGILFSKQVLELRAMMEVEERSELELQDLRDFLVCSLGKTDEYDPKDLDCMSACTGVVDQEKSNRGMPI